MLNAARFEQILKALFTKQDIKLVLNKYGTKELNFMPNPVKVSFLKTEVLNKLFILVILISKKFKVALVSNSQVNEMLLCCPLI